MLIEQQHMIETLRAQLQLALRRQFGPRNEYVDVDQLGLFAGAADPSTVIELNDIDPPSSRVTTDCPADREVPVRKKAVRILKDLPRQITPVDIPEADKACSCCGARMKCIGVDSSEHLGYEPATIRILVTERKKYVRVLPWRGEAGGRSARPAARQEHGLGQSPRVPDRQ